MYGDIIQLHIFVHIRLIGRKAGLFDMNLTGRGLNGKAGLRAGIFKGKES